MSNTDDKNDVDEPAVRIPVRVVADSDVTEEPADATSVSADPVIVEVVGVDSAPPVPEIEEVSIPRARFVAMGQEKLRMEERLKAMQAEVYQAKATATASDEKIKELQDAAVRQHAETQNFRKRIEREREESFRYVHQEPLSELLPVLDNFFRALQAPRTAENASDFDKGIELIYRQLTDALARFDLVPFDSVGKLFDPNRHEAVTQAESDEIPAEHVIREMRQGYMYKDRLLRPAMVEVSLGRPGAVAAEAVGTEHGGDITAEEASADAGEGGSSTGE